MFASKNYIIKFQSYFDKLSNWILKHRLFVLFLCLSIGISGALLSFKIRSDSSLEVYFLDDDPSFLYYQHFMEEYGNDEFIYLVYTSSKGIFNKEIIDKTKTLVGELETIPYVKRVTSVANLKILESDTSGNLKFIGIPQGQGLSQEKLNEFAGKLVKKPLMIDSYISEDHKFGAIFCEIEKRPVNAPNYQLVIGKLLKKILSQPQYKDFKFWPVGEPVINSEYIEILDKDSELLSILSFSFIFILLIYFFKQIKGVAGPLIVVMFALLLVLGIMGIFDFPKTIMFDITPSLLLAIGVSSSVHLISEYQSFLRKGYDNRNAILNSVKLVGFPCMFTSITTAVGFGSLMVSPIRALREFGLYSVSGILSLFFFTFTILLVVLSIGGKHSEKHFKLQKDNPKAQKIKLMDKLLTKVAEINIKRNKTVVIVFLALSMVSLWGVFKLEINSSWLEELGDKLQVTKDYKFVDKTIGGTGSFELLLDSKEPDQVKSIQFTHLLQKIQNHIDTKTYLVKKTYSIVDILKDVNQTLHFNDPSYYKLPQSDEEISQFLLLYEISGGETIENLVSADFAAARLTIYVKSTDAKTSKKFYDDLVSYIKSVIPKNYTYRITGASFLTLEAMRYVGETQIESIILAIAIICLMMIAVFRSIRIGLISMLPNLFTILFVLGIMGWFGIWLDAVRTMIACIAIGLAVDDTIHFISRYRMEFEAKKNYEAALRSSLNNVGRAITITSFILIIGFGVTVFSKLYDIYYFGLLSSSCILIALIADYFIGPSLILLFRPFGKESDAGQM